MHRSRSFLLIFMSKLYECMLTVNDSSNFFFHFVSFHHRFHSMCDVMKTFACVSLQSTVKGFILFSFTDRSLALLVQRCSTVFVTTLLALVSCSCVFDKNTRANINIGTTDEYVQFNIHCARNRENGREKWARGMLRTANAQSKQMFK